VYAVKSYEYSVTLSGVSISPYRTALYDHFTNAVDSLWELDPNVINQSSDNFVIRQKEETGRFQLSISVGGASSRSFVIIDKGLGILDAQIPLSGSPNIFSLGETFRIPINTAGTISHGLSSDIFIIETKDSITLLPKLYDNSRRFVFHVGDILKPLYSNDVDYGLDGFGVVSGLMAGDEGALTGTVAGSGILGTNSTYFKVSENEITGPCGTDYSISSRIPTLADLSIGGRTEPATIPMCIPYPDIPSSTTRLRHVGDLKYIKAWTSNSLSNQIISDSESEQSFICIISYDFSTIPSNQAFTLFPWEYGKQVINL
jgi:hypothetical protein